MSKAGSAARPVKDGLLCILPNRIEDFQDLLFERCGSTHVAPNFLSLEEAVIGPVMIRDHEVGDFVSPELAAADVLKLPGRSPLPLGVVIGRNWPLCVGRTVAEDLQLETSFRSPKGEEAWAVRYGSLYWVFPNWRLDWRDQMDRLRRAGYNLFIHLMEAVPPADRLKDRPGLWNWEGELK